MSDQAPTQRAIEKWVPVNDRLPEKDGQYLVNGPHNVELACWNSYHKCWDDASGDDYWHDPIGWFTHWMPLPEPPKGTK